jgi:hypothetical protein
MTPERKAQIQALWQKNLSSRQAATVAPSTVIPIASAEVPAQPGHRSTPCVHELAVIETCTGCRGAAWSVRECGRHDRCTRQYRDGSVRACSMCPDYQPGLELWEWISLEQLTRDTLLFASKLPRTFSGVGGVVRSGMIPASILSCVLHLPLWEIGEEGAPVKLRSGNRGRGILSEGPLLVIDDTIWAGTARNRVARALSSWDYRYGVIYVRDGLEHLTNYYHKTVTSLHVLEWNWSTHGGISSWSRPGSSRRGIATDLDGIIVHDEQSPGAPGAPYMVPYNVPIPVIITGRPERYRSITELHLRSIGARWDRLIMRPDQLPEDNISISFFKSKQFFESGCEIFFESEPTQAEVIHRETGLPVFCPRADRVYQKKS